MTYSHIAESRRLVLPALLLVLSAAGAKAEPASVADQLGEALTEQGWSRVEAADGSVLYKRLPAEAEAEAAAPAQAEPPAESADSMADQLRRQLETAGWSQTVAPDGSLIYRAPGVAEPTAPAGRDTPGSSPAQQLQHALGTAGWREIRAEDGSVYYLPPARPAVEQPTGVTTPDADAASAAAESSAVADRQVQTPKAAHGGPAVAGGLAARFQDALSAHGWVRFEAADGSVIYRRSLASAGGGTGYGQQALADDLRAQMEALGWVGAVATDGSMVYWPPGEAADGAGTAMATGAEVSRPPGARTRGVPRAAIAPHGCCQGWRQWSHPAPPAWQHAPWVIPHGRFWQR